MWTIKPNKWQVKLNKWFVKPNNQWRHLFHRFWVVYYTPNATTTTTTTTCDADSLEGEKKKK